MNLRCWFCIILIIIILSVQVSNLVAKSSQALAKIGLYDPEDLPPEFKPTINFVYKVSKLFGDIKADVMGFVNVRKHSFIFLKLFLFIQHYVCFKNVCLQILISYSSLLLNLILIISSSLI